MPKSVDKVLSALNTASGGTSFVALLTAEGSADLNPGSATMNADEVKIVWRGATGGAKQWDGVVVAKSPSVPRLFFAALGAPSVPGTGTESRFTVTIGTDTSTFPDAPALYQMSGTLDLDVLRKKKR